MLINIPKGVGTNNVPPAIYKVTCTGVKHRMSQTGNVVIQPEMTIQNQGPDASVKTIGRKLFGNWTLTEASLGIVNTGYKALTGHDLPAGDFEIEELIDIIGKDIMNHECLVQVELQVGNDGVERNNIKKWTKIQG